jgi:hypothetical protein
MSRMSRQVRFSCGAALRLPLENHEDVRRLRICFTAKSTVISNVSFPSSAVERRASPKIAFCGLCGPNCALPSPEVTDGGISHCGADQKIQCRNRALA